MNPLEKPIVNWFKKNKRDLPWRTATPWGVMVSEYMLQQTPVNRVLPKWIEWMERWPTPKDLAAATPAQVITAWGRLGYPRRALRLHAAAQIIAEDFNNEVPEDELTLQQLPGIGEYTAAAIAAFAFDQRSLVMDVNIRRVLTRVIHCIRRKNHERGWIGFLICKSTKSCVEEKTWNAALGNAYRLMY